MRFTEIDQQPEPETAQEKLRVDNENGIEDLLPGLILGPLWTLGALVCFA